MALVSLAALLALSAPGVLPVAGAQINPTKTPVAGDPAVIPYAVSTVRESKGSARPCPPFPEYYGSVRAFTATCAPLTTLIGYAYGLQEKRIVDRPAWLDTKRFDIKAKSDAADLAVPDALPDDLKHEYNLRQLQLLLVERFHLKVHTERREIPVYALVVAKGGPKMRPADDKSSFAILGVHDLPNSSSPGTSGIDRGRLIGISTSIDRLANFLAFYAAGDLDRPIMNKTGLAGPYDFQLKWTPEAGMASDQADSSRPGLFTAIQEQLGLKLEPKKGSMEVLVIDHVEMPTEN